MNVHSSLLGSRPQNCTYEWMMDGLYIQQSTGICKNKIIFRSSFASHHCVSMSLVINCLNKREWTSWYPRVAENHLQNECKGSFVMHDSMTVTLQYRAIQDTQRALRLASCDDVAAISHYFSLLSDVSNHQSSRQVHVFLLYSLQYIIERVPSSILLSSSLEGARHAKPIFPLPLSKKMTN